ncbi:MAG: hypothetical protein GF344_10810 [Chitinivibrionales bacterium]|nr:hypothetical protein [Chitinivibrionales bacterium]MBD3357294.1 hypothetical protein [Chitinivibrionales bacterium]
MRARYLVPALVAVVVVLSASMYAGCNQKGTAEKAEEKAEKIGENTEEAIDKIDGEGALREAAEEVEEFGDDAKESLKDLRDNIEESVDRAKVERRIETIIAETKEEMRQAGENTAQAAENTQEKISEITEMGKQRIRSVIDSVKSST